MRSLFGGKKQPEPGTLLETRWSSSFGLLGGRRFPEEEAPDHAVRYRRGRFELEIRKSSSFAWVTGAYKYKDFVLEGRISMASDNGHSAVGLVFRHVNDENFYHFLVSNRGSFRLDVVFNRNPIHLIEWTPCPLPAAETFETGLPIVRLRVP